MQPDPIQVAVMSEYGAGKSYFAATFPKPMLVLHPDPFGKAQPYLDKGLPQPWEVGEFGQPVRRVVSPKASDRTLIQLEFFHDAEPMRPAAFEQMFRRAGRLADEVKAGEWATVVLDTFTSMELYARYRRTYGQLKSDTPNILSTEDVEQMLTRVCTGLSAYVNVVLLCHIDERPVSMDSDRSATDKKGNKFLVGGQLKATPKAPGRLQKGIGALFASEMYHLYVTPPDKDGLTSRLLQTQPNGFYACATRIDAPNPCEPRYAALWTNWIEKQKAKGESA